jgi:hypothetical protein
MPPEQPRPRRRATEAYTVRLAGRQRAFLPMYSHMLATEPLSDATWEQIGWSGCEPVADQHHLFAYAQRTVDGRIAIGGAARRIAPEASFARPTSFDQRSTTASRANCAGGFPLPPVRRSRTAGAARSRSRATGRWRSTATAPRASRGRAD